MQNFRLFPPCILWEMPGNNKFDPIHKVKIVPKFEKSTDRDYKLMSSEGGQDTSACKISGHSLHAFSGKCLETSPDRRTCRKTVSWSRTHVQVERRYFRLRTSLENLISAAMKQAAPHGRTDGPTDNPKT